MTDGIQFNAPFVPAQGSEQTNWRPAKSPDEVNLLSLSPSIPSRVHLGSTIQLPVDQTSPNVPSSDHIWLPGQISGVSGSATPGGFQDVFPSWNIAPPIDPVSQQAPQLETKETAKNGVDQGTYGDCFFEAALASMSATADGAAAIDKMSIKNADDSYTVTFPSQPDVHIQVSPQELHTYQVKNQTEQNNAIEIAFLKLDRVPAEQTGNDAIKTWESVTTPADALELLTGKNVVFEPTKWFGSCDPSLGSVSKEHLVEDIQNALKRGDPVTAASDSIPKEAQGPDHSKYYPSGDSYPLPGNHEYSIIAYDSKSSTITLRNPWGGMDGTPLAKVGDTKFGITNLGDGEISMSMDTFAKYFREVSFAGSSQFSNTADHVGDDFKQSFSSFGSGNFSDGFHRLGTGLNESAFLLSQPVLSTVDKFSMDMVRAVRDPSISTDSRALLEGAAYLGTAALVGRFVGGLGSGILAKTFIRTGTIVASMAVASQLGERLFKPDLHIQS